MLSKNVPINAVYEKIMETPHWIDKRNLRPRWHLLKWVCYLWEIGLYILEKLYPTCRLVCGNHKFQKYLQVCASEGLHNRCSCQANEATLTIWKFLEFASLTFCRCHFQILNFHSFRHVLKHKLLGIKYNICK